jgi:hypothetical protein
MLQNVITEIKTNKTHELGTDPNCLYFVCYVFQPSLATSERNIIYAQGQTEYSHGNYTCTLSH